ncbi:MAG: UvrD-helicase domain-containing protein [Bacilli bacterium]|nr:UvrD-helicase domain-containing protein [Bacilli bacterium]
MPKFTVDQQKAIDLEGKNIIVSASAGSGKTAVLTERVFRKIKSGISVDNLLVLTFTNKAAAEMKDRIRKKLEKEKLVEETEKIESASITTFDAYALELVKRYSDILNVSKDIEITDINIVNLYNKKILEEILDEYYEKKEKNFLDLIKKFCLKDDDNLKELILDIFNKLDLLYDKNAYLNKYLDVFYDDNFYSYVKEELENILLKKISYIRILLNRLQDNEVNFYDSFERLLASNNYEEIKRNIDFSIPKSPNNSSEEVKSFRKELKLICDEIKEVVNEDFESTFVLEKDLISVLIDILKELSLRTKIFKDENNIYTFADIYKLSIKLVNDYEDIRDELKYKYNEILIDEYQDTSDLQELFISKIENNNIYVVGDVKQSIYKFRNANYHIFKEKYDSYKSADNSEVIDLNKNFRSRAEVLKSINDLFKYLMRKDISFLDYNDHYMDFGFSNYNELKNENSNYDLEIYTYDEERASKEEQEIFIIANDIKEKMDREILIFDKEIGTLRKVKYSDFTILIDRATSFDTYKKVFEYLGIPLSLEKDYDLSLEDDIYIFKNIIKLLIMIKENNFDEEFKKAYLSVGRSFLFRYSDQQLFVDLTSNKYIESELYRKCLNLAKDLDSISAAEMFMQIIKEFNYEERLNYITNIKLFRKREKSIYELIEGLEEAGNTIYEIPDLLEELLDDNNIKIALEKENIDAVRIMTIHKSKGLEFPICYFAGFYKKFNMRDLSKKILFNKELGIVFSDNAILKYILKEKETEAEIDEQIRLLYVALTRAREKMIIVMPKIEDYNDELTGFEKSHYNSFLSIIKSIYKYLDKYIIPKKVELDTNYKYPKELMTNLEGKGKLNVQNFDIRNEQIEKKKYSKESTLLDEEVVKNMDFGTKVHQILEYIDFNNPRIENMDIPGDIRSKVEKFINSDLIKVNKNSKFYQEYEFVDNDSLGIIDLMIENDKELIIVDYKLKNIEDEAYKKQLKGYKDVISKKTNKEIKTYLYSIYEERLKEIL